MESGCRSDKEVGGLARSAPAILLQLTGGFAVRCQRLTTKTVIDTQTHHALQESFWDALLLAGLDEIGPAGTVMIIVGVAEPLLHFLVLGEKPGLASQFGSVCLSEPADSGVHVLGGTCIVSQGAVPVGF